MALIDAKLITLDGLNEFKIKMCGWVNDKFFVGTKDEVTANFQNIPNGTFIFITDDEIDVGDLAAVEPDETDIQSLFGDEEDPDVGTLF